MSFAQTAQGVCVCSPSSISFTLDFSLQCPPENIVTGVDKGIDRVFCQVTEEPRPDVVAGLDDLVPVNVTAVNIFELGLDLRVIKQSFLPGVNLLNGETIVFESIVNEYDAQTLTSQNTPGGLQIVFKGLNADGVAVTNSFILTYSNRCDVVPFFEGDSIGWAVIVSTFLTFH